MWIRYCCLHDGACCIRIKEERDRRTWCKFLESLLYLRYKFPNVGWWPCPKDQTVSRIDKAGLDTWVFKPLEDGIRIKPFEVRGKQIYFLLSIAYGAMSRVPVLNLFLQMLVEILALYLEHEEAAKLFLFLGTVECLGNIVRMESLRPYRIIFTSFDPRIVRVRERCGVNPG